MTIQPVQLNTYSLNHSSRGADICQVLASAFNGVDAEAAVRSHVTFKNEQLAIDGWVYHLRNYSHVYIFGVGKASVRMAIALYQILGERITSGLVITKKGTIGVINNLGGLRLTIMEANHPVPDRSNLAASTIFSSFFGELRKEDLVICCISGGGSALLTKPFPGISLEDLQTTTRSMLACGADIREFNTVRKHLDEFKGGKLARFFSPASVVTLILSDVVGDFLDSIASGPTVADPTTYQEAWSIFNKYQITDKIPQSVRSIIQAGMVGDLPETLKPGDPILEMVRNVIVGNNLQAVRTAEKTAQALGLNTNILTTSLHGEASHAGSSLFEQTKQLLLSQTVSRPACFIAGGETTVTIHGTGKGGRNQELVLGSVEEIAGNAQYILVSLATDGEDGPTDAAGAVATNLSLQRSASIGLNPADYLANNDSYHYFEQLGDLFKPGPTLTNVNDLVFIFAF